MLMLRDDGPGVLSALKPSNAGSSGWLVSANTQTS